MNYLFEVLKIIVPTVTSILFTLFWQDYQFRRANKYSYKLKIRTLRQLVTESIIQCESDIVNVQNFISDSNKKIVLLPSLTINAYSAIEQLSNRVINDDYYTAYSMVFKKVIKTDSIYYGIKRVSISLHKRHIQLTSSIENEWKSDYDRRKVFVECVNQLKNKAVDISNNKSLDEDIRGAIFSVANNYVKKRKTDDDLNEMYDELLKPLIQLHLDFMHDIESLNEYSELIIDAKVQYDNIVRENTIFIERIKNYLPQYKIELNNLKEFNTVINKPNLLKMYE